MSEALRDAWVLLGLTLAQLVMTFVFLALVPYAFLMNQAQSDKELEEKIVQFSEFTEEHQESELGPNELLEKLRPLVAPLFRAVPWTLVVLLGSLLIYPFLGWWSSKLLNQAQGGGVLILMSLLMEQNICLTPLKLEHWSSAEVALSLPWTLFFIVLQFILLTFGILAERGQSLLKGNTP